MKLITCDAPAKSFIIGSKQFNGKEGCDKYLLLGQSYNGATIYLGDSFTKRTDYDFKCMKYPGHQNY